MYKNRIAKEYPELAPLMAFLMTHGSLNEKLVATGVRV